VRLVYIDDSGDHTRDIACFAAVMIDASQWAVCQQRFDKMRIAMKSKFGIFRGIELHATEFLGGRKAIAPKKIDIPTRVQIARGVLKWISLMPSVQVFGASMKCAEKDRAFERLLNRIEKNVSLSGTQALLISDEGKDYNKLLYAMRKSNPIPSALGAWSSGSASKSIPIANIVERIWFRKSSDCNFIQAADFCAYALLRQDAPYPKHTALGIDKLYSELDACLVKLANKKDPQGVIR